MIFAIIIRNNAASANRKSSFHTKKTRNAEAFLEKYLITSVNQMREPRIFSIAAMPSSVLP